jgi:hypothetical protein
VLRRAIAEFAGVEYQDIDRLEICGMLRTICNNIKGGDLVSIEILEKGVTMLGNTAV